jgi:hypothetical protein
MLGKQDVRSDKGGVMGDMQRSMAELLAQVGRVEEKTLLRVPRWPDVDAAGYVGAVESVYRGLGGVVEQVNEAVQGLRHLRAWDLEFNGVALELDEHLHMNRYRAETLRSRVYQGLEGFPLALYARYCVDFESNCLRAGAYGGKWSNASCERQFGKGDPAGALQNKGSPRWKQRAFYDFVKDLSPLLFDLPLARIAWCDRIFEDGRQRTVAEILIRPSAASASVLAQLVRERTVRRKGRAV